MKQLRIAVDIDDTINYAKGIGEPYGMEVLQPGALETLRRWKQEGHYIIIHTSRHLNGSGHNPGLAMAREGLTLLKWLEDNHVPYDEIWWSKPYANVYIDDKAVTHVVGDWRRTAAQIDRIAQEK
jgi:histidinol phosphatase-like enzyme